MTYEQTIRNWNRVYSDERKAGHPGWACSESYLLKQSRIADALACHNISSPASFLEIGCGAGNITLWMASQGFDANGIDVAPEAIQWARDKAAGLKSVSKFFVGNLADMNMFPSNHFDVIFDGDCLHMIIDKRRRNASFCELFRITKPGGLLIAGGNVGYDDIISRVKSGAEKRFSYDPENSCFIFHGDPEYDLKYIHRTEYELCVELKSAGFVLYCVCHYPKRGRANWIKECIAIHAVKPLFEKSASSFPDP